MNLLRLARAVASPTRLALLEALGAGELTVTEAAEAVGVAPSTASVGLGVLRRAGLAEERWRGREHVYRRQRKPVTLDLGGPATPAGGGENPGRT